MAFRVHVILYELKVIDSIMSSVEIYDWLSNIDPYQCLHYSRTNKTPPGVVFNTCSTKGMSFISHLVRESFYRGKFSPPFVIEIQSTKPDLSVKKDKLIKNETNNEKNTCYVFCSTWIITEWLKLSKTVNIKLIRGLWNHKFFWEKKVSLL